jgi:tryptophan synthase beta chain
MPGAQPNDDGNGHAGLPLRAFSLGLIEQEVATDRYIQIPDEVREAYKCGWPTPLIRARRLEKALGTPAHIYFKYEGLSRPPATPLNPTRPSPGLLQQDRGTKAMTTETGAGSSGDRAGHVVQVLRSRPRGSICARLVRPETLPALPDGNFWRAGLRQPQQRTTCGSTLLAENPRNSRIAGHPPSPRQWEVAGVPAARRNTDWAPCLHLVLLQQSVIARKR